VIDVGTKVRGADSTEGELITIDSDNDIDLYILAAKEDYKKPLLERQYGLVSVPENETTNDFIPVAYKGMVYYIVPLHMVTIVDSSHYKIYSYDGPGVLINKDQITFIDTSITYVSATGELYLCPLSAVEEIETCGDSDDGFFVLVSGVWLGCVQIFPGKKSSVDIDFWRLIIRQILSKAVDDGVLKQVVAPIDDEEDDEGNDEVSEINEDSGSKKEGGEKVKELVAWMNSIEKEPSSLWKEGVLGPKHLMITLIPKFYTLAHINTIAHSKEVEEELEKVSEELAVKMSNYVLCSCFGEARHYASCLDSMSDVLKALWNTRRIVTRSGFWKVAWELAQKNGRENILEDLVWLFHQNGWSSGIGGQKWAYIAKLGLEFERGVYTRRMFIDAIVNAVHNGGWAFNKWYDKDYFCCDVHRTVSFTTLLNIKAENASDLCAYICLHDSITDKLLELSKPTGEAVDIVLKRLESLRNRKEYKEYNEYV